MLFWPVEAVQAQGDPFCSQCIHLYNFCTGDGSQALRKQNNQVTNQRSSDWLKVLYRQLHTLGVRSAKASKLKKKATGNFRLGIQISQLRQPRFIEVKGALFLSISSRSRLSTRNIRGHLMGKPSPLLVKQHPLDLPRQFIRIPH